MPSSFRKPSPRDAQVRAAGACRYERPEPDRGDGARGDGRQPGPQHRAARRARSPCTTARPRKTARVHRASSATRARSPPAESRRGVRRPRSSGRAGSSSWSRPARPVDAVIDELAPLLDEGDIVIDAGNSHFADTKRRTEACARARAALHGHRRLRRRGGRAARAEHHARRRRARPTPRSSEMFTAIAAQVDGTPCCALRRPGRRRPLREDGPQRHRVRRHAADRRGLRPAAPRRRADGRRRSPTSSTSGTRGDLESFLIEITRRCSRKDDERPASRSST